MGSDPILTPLFLQARDPGGGAVVNERPSRDRNAVEGVRKTPGIVDSHSDPVATDLCDHASNPVPLGDSHLHRAADLCPGLRHSSLCRGFSDSARELRVERGCSHWLARTTGGHRDDRHTREQRVQIACGRSHVRGATPQGREIAPVPAFCFRRELARLVSSCSRG